MQAEGRTYAYTFHLEQARRVEFAVTIDAISLSISSCPVVPPKWAKLQYHQCQPCPLQSLDHPFCPMAVCISELVSAFTNTASYEHCFVTCETPERLVSKTTIVQEGLASILGLLMATSGCPVMAFFKPLARFHLPFASVDESVFRIVSVYMLRQYYLRKNSVEECFSLQEMKNHYMLVKQVNRGIFDRILSITELDADKNAIITLNSLAQILEMEIDTNLESLRYLFPEG